MKYFLLFFISFHLLAEVNLELLLSSVDKYYPEIQSSLNQFQIEHEKSKSAFGAYDTKIISDNTLVPKGYFTRRLWDVKVEKPISPLYGKAYVGYSNGFSGLFPPQFSTQSTNSGGSPRLGLEFSVLKNALIDPRKAHLLKTDLESKGNQLNIIQEQLDLKLLAVQNYWSWLASVRQFLAQKELFELVLKRGDYIDQQIKVGALSKMIKIEFEQNLARRQAELIESERLKEMFRYELSLFYRDSNGERILLSDSDADLTEMDNAILEIPHSLSFEDESQKILSISPQILSLEKFIQSNEYSIKLAKNDLFPKLDLSTDYTRNLGDQDPMNAPHVWTVGIKFEIPIERNLVQAEYQKAILQKNSFHYQRTLKKDQVINTVQKSLLNLDFLKKKVEFSRIESKNARTLIEAESLKFKSGSSNLLTVNLRENLYLEALHNMISTELSYLTEWSLYKNISRRFKAPSDNSI
jgi:outer membrane protein TolC